MTTRGGLKLEAALETFGLRAAVRGSVAVDVGASTGGFTGSLLRHGAVQVTAVDVGHSQLEPHLRKDERVVVLEKADWKTLSLSVAPGPFDFFSVDVSFVAARNMLRGLAFRLRDGAQGVVLLKPQFELPSRDVQGGDVSDPALRARALDQFSQKAIALGFVVVKSVDSPVAGGSGTVEILVHLRFAGRTTRIPAVGEHRGQAPKKLRRGKGGTPADIATAQQTWFAVASPGLEEPVRAEVAALPGVSAVTVVRGGVTFAGSVETGMRANLGLRVATRVVLRLGGGKAREFAKLRRLVSELRWDAFVPRGRPVVISASATHCRLFHTGALAETVVLGISDKVGTVTAVRPADATADEETGEVSATRILIRGEDDIWTLSLDSSGELLHRRGWRIEPGLAPLRETLAAGLLALAEHDPALPFIDPMCGAGTIAIEAAARALNRAPGLGRSFAFERWLCHDPALWDGLRAEARAAMKSALPGPVLAFDRDARAVETARRNAERAGLSAHVRIEQVAFGDQAAPAGTGLLLCNPPYGRRIGDPRVTAQLMRQMGRTLRERFAGWRAGILAPAATPVTAIGLPVRANHRLSNGGLRVHLICV